MEAINNRIMPDTLRISSLAYNQMATKIFNSFHGTTILKQIETMLRVTVKCTPELNKAVDGTTGCFIFFKNNSHYVEQLITSFFHTEDPIEETFEGTYSDRNADIKMVEYGWNHTLSDVTNSIIGNGLTINSLKEFNYSPYNCFNNMIELEKDKFVFKKFGNKLPLVYSLAATKIKLP